MYVYIDGLSLERAHPIYGLWSMSLLRIHALDRRDVYCCVFIVGTVCIVNTLKCMEWKYTVWNRFTGTVSRELSHRLLYIIWKLFSRPIITSHKVLTLLKGQFTIYKKQAGAPLYSDMVLSRQYWNRRKMGVSAILKFATAPLSDMISRKSTDPPYFQSFSWF